MTDKEYIAACMVVEADNRTAAANAAREKAETDNKNLRSAIEPCTLLASAMSARGRSA